MSEKLTLEEIKSLSNAELGQQLAELCGFRTVVASGIALYYRNWQRKDIQSLCKKLCHSLDAVAEVEKIVIEKVGIDNYYEAVCKTSNEEFIATARERAEACLLALQENNL